MKKVSYFFIAIIFILVLYFINLYSSKPAGRDTVAYFGDGTYQILKGYNSEFSKKEYSLWKEDNLVLNYVYEYKIDKDNKNVYIIGKENIESIDYVYLILDYNLKQEKKLMCNELSHEQFEIFITKESTFTYLKNNVLDTKTNDNCQINI